ncbi:MAG: hypothetical protein K6L76_03455 [Agarilytica sp.]
MLHIISGTQPALILQLLEYVQEGDTLTFTDEAFYLKQHELLQKELHERCISAKLLLTTNSKQHSISASPRICYSEFVSLCETHPTIKTWY